MTNEARERFLDDLRSRGLLSGEEVATARRLLAEAAADGREVPLAEVLIRAGAAAAKAHHEAAAFERGEAGADAGGADALAAPESSGLELLERIGRGSQAVVYKCRQVEMDRTVAVKILHPRAAGEAEARERFLREARAAAVLAHPNVVTIHEIRPLKNTVSIVMEYVDGGTLADLLKVRRRFDPAEAVVIVRQVAEGLRAAHGRGIIHRDIKPRNIMLTGDGLVKIADMGLARHVAEGEGPQGKASGTPYYISPEQVTGDPPPDHRTDLYSLGVTLYEMVAGRPPFVADDPRQIMRLHVLGTPPDPRDFVPDLPPALAWFLAKAMAREPEDRYQSAEEFLEALDGLDLRVEPAEGPRTLLAQMEPVTAADRRRTGRADLLAQAAAATSDAAGPRSGRRRAVRDDRLRPGQEPGAAGRAKTPARAAALLTAGGVAAVVLVTVVILYAAGVFDAEAPPPPGPTAGGPTVQAPPPPPPDELSRPERDALAALESARRLEKAPDAWQGDVLQAYRNVITFYPDTKAAAAAEMALARLGASLEDASPPPVPPPRPKPSPEKGEPEPPAPQPDPEPAPAEPPKPEPAPAEPAVIEVQASKDVQIRGEHARYESGDDRDNIGFWNNTDTWVSWEIRVPRRGTYAVEITYAAHDNCHGNRYRVAVGDAAVEDAVETTGDWGRFETKRIGALEIEEAGTRWLSVQPLSIKGGGLMNLQAVRLTEVR
jgi:tRNA A-37 threonylcarbamoyl transferase component Bud32